MRTMTILTLFLALLPLASAQEGASAPTAPTASTAANARFVWTGVALGPKGERFGPAPVIDTTATSHGTGSKSVVTRASPRATADAHLKELATIRLSIDVDRKLDDAQTKLDDLLVRAASKQDYVARFEVVQEVALARSELFDKRGRKDAALAAVAQLLPDAALRDAFAAKYEFEPASEALIAAEAKALAAPAVVHAAARLRPGGANTQKSGTAKDVAQDSSIEANVRAWLSTNDEATIRELGTRAVPVLEKVVLEALDAMPPDASADALTLLFQLDEARGAEFALARFDAGGYLWKKRILRGIQAGNVLKDRDTWMTGPDQSHKPQLLDQAWVPLIERLLRDPELREDTLREVVWVFTIQDALSPAMQTALNEAFASGKSGEVQAAFEALQNAYGRSTALGVLERATASSDAAVRRFAAQLLLDEERSPALLALASDPDAEVRRMVISSLRVRQRRGAMFNANPQPLNAYKDTKPVLGVAERAALRALIEDTQLKVREDAVELALGINPPLDGGAYLVIARDPNPELRVKLAQRMPRSLDNAPDVLGVLASDKDVTVRSALDASLEHWLKERGDAILPVLFQRIEAPGAPSMESGGRTELWQAVRRAVRMKAGIVRVLELATAKEREWLVPYLLDGFPWMGKAETPNWSALQALDDASFAAFVRVARRVQPDWMENFADGAFRTAQEGHVLRTAWYETLEDTNASRGVRLRAASILALQADARCEDGLRAILQLESWTTGALEATESGPLSDLGKVFNSERRTDYFRGLIQDARVQSAPLRWMIGNAEKDGLAMAILDRWLDAPRANVGISILSEAVAALPSSDDPKAVSVLKRCLRVEGVEGSVLQVLGRMKAPFGLELLSESLEASWLTDREHRERVQRSAAIALTGYMSEEAARRLLAGVTLASTEGARKTCLDGVEQIRTYLDEKKRWDLRDSELEQRAQAVRELLALLGDADASTRAQAAKSLATLNAAEHLPKLIALIKDKAPEVRAAAQQAIDQLNAKSAK